MAHRFGFEPQTKGIIMDIQEIIKQKFTSSNSIPVDLIRITREEYDQLIDPLMWTLIERDGLKWPTKRGEK